jgi:TRAP-type C4-dicarboxylate transport system permease small subunit
VTERSGSVTSAGRAWFWKLSEFLCLAAGVLVLGAAFILVVDVAVRNFSAPLGWPFDVIRYLFLYSVFMAAPAALLSNSLIRVTLLVEKLPKPTYRAVTVLGFGVSLVYLGVLLWQCLNTLAIAIRHSWQSDASHVPIPVAYLYGAMAMGSVLLIIAAYVRLRDDLRQSSAAH